MELWRAMGLEGKRALIIHHDDLGYTHAQNAAYRNLCLPTGSVLLPAAWAAELALLPAGSHDLGVHLTLTSEWTHPRIRPLTGGASLRDPTGHLWPTLAEAWSHADPAEAAAELRAQIEAALALGLDVTHIDTHMGGVLRPDIAAAYHQLAVEYRLPCFLPEPLAGIGLPGPFLPALEQLLAASPLPRFRPLDTYPVPPAEKRDWFLDTLPRLGPGVYHLIHHAQLPTPEGQALPDWENRQADFEALQDAAVRRVIAEFVPLTYREVRDALRRYA